MSRARILLEKLAKGEAMGGHVFFNDPAITEAMAGYGYDFIWIDAEHGPFDKQTLLMHVMAAKSGGSAAFVRVVSQDPNVIKPVLEMGVDGIIIPMVMDAVQAEAVLSACLYPPEGIRGFGPRRAIAYNAQSLEEYLKEAKDSFLRILQVEHISAVEHIEAILALPALDAIIIGPNDLSGSIGMLGRTLHPDVLALGKRVIEAAKRAGKPVGVSIGPDEKAMQTWLGLGVDFISCGDDISFIAKGAQNTLETYARLKL